MSCDQTPQKGQTLTERKTEVRAAIASLSAALVAGRAKAIIGPTGGIAFAGWDERSRVTDACAYRMILATGSALAKAAIAKAEQLAGRTVSRQAVAQGHHAHMHGGELHWHDHKG
jgi:hypothetical protein